MPHSPRLHGGRLWLLDSGTGRFGLIEPATGRFEEVCFCPGYARGLAFAGELRGDRPVLAAENRSFSGLALDEELRRHGAVPRCGLLVVDLRTGDAPHSLRSKAWSSELYDVAAMLGRGAPDGARLQQRRDPSPDHHRRRDRLSRPYWMSLRNDYEKRTSDLPGSPLAADGPGQRIGVAGGAPVARLGVRRCWRWA